MTKQLFLNNFESVFVASVRATPSSGNPSGELDYGVLRLSDGASGQLLAPTPGDFYVLTAYKRSGTAETDLEIMHVTGVDNSTPGECRVTVLRAQEGTTAKAYDPGDFVSLRWTRGAADRMVQRPEMTDALAGKVDKVAGKGLSTEDFTTSYKGSLDNLPSALAGKVDAASLAPVAAPGKVPKADGKGLLDPSWFAAIYPSLRFNDIGVPGAQGFGVGICPALPTGFTALPGSTDVASDNYGNYQYSDGSVMCWIPAFYLRRGHADNPTFAAHGANSVDVKPLSAFPDEVSANAQGYYLHRAFINGGQRQLGFFRDKYDCSLNGNVASSIQGQAPLVSGPVAGQNGFALCTGNGQAPGNYYGGAIPAARSRGSQFFPATVFMADALATLAEAHAQAATSAAHCAWYDAAGVANYPKGNNSGALKDSNDTGVTYTSAGNATYPAFAMAGSGAPFAKTTHNGQASGVADVNGNVWKVSPGMTSIGTTAAITGASKTNPVQVTVPGHGRATGDTVGIFSVVGMTQLNDKFYKVTVVDANTLALDGVDGTSFGAYTSGGALYHARFYLLRPSADIAKLGWGASAATDHWGAAGVAANFDEVVLNFNTTYPNNGLGQRYGSGSNAVFDWTTPAGRALAMAGMPAAGGMSPAGTNAMGQDYYYQHMVNQLCVISGGYWDHGVGAGVRARDLYSSRVSAYYAVGFAACRYL